VKEGRNRSNERKEDREVMKGNKRRVTKKGMTTQNTDTVIGTATMLWVGWSRGQFPVGVRNYLYSKECRPTLGPTQLPIKWLSGAFPSL
jgi:hypothetical protein